MQTVLALGLALTIAATADAGDVGFAKKPAVQKSGEGYAIAFAVSAPTDVEVAVVDAKGKAVRHLAAGVLGGTNPPPAPLKPGLAQSIVWDGKNDLDQKAEGGPFTVRVRAGLSVSFGRLIGTSPYTGRVGSTPYRAPLNGLVAGPDGTLYILMMSDIHSHGNSGLWPWHLRQFTREGEYRKTLLPYPPSTDPGKASGMTLLTTPDGAFTPAHQNSLYPVLYVFGDEILPRLADGRVVFVNSRSRVLNFFAVAGSNDLKTMPMWSPKAGLQCAYFLSIQAALSPDGRYVYYSNVAPVPYDPKSPADIPDTWPNGRIYRQDLTRPGSDPVRFFDLDPPEKHTWVPNAWNKKTAAGAIDCDAKGNLLICDLAAQGVVEVSPEGRQLSVIKVAWPEKVLASRKTDALYVISKKFQDKNGGEGPPTLYKFTGRGEKAVEAAKLPLRGVVGGAVTLDESGDVPVLWVGGGGGLLAIEDRGRELVVTKDRVLNRDPSAIGFVGYMDVDREAELVYVTASGSSVWRHHGETGEGGLIKLKAVDLAIGRDGTLYTWGIAGGYHGPIGRFTRSLEPAPLAKGGHTYGALSGRAGRGSSVCGMAVDARGRVYAVNGSNHCHLIVYDENGTPVDFPTRLKGRTGEIPVLMDQISGYGGSIRVDLAGNIYLLQPGSPKGFKPPKGWEKDPAYAATQASILKFGPEGGKRNTPLNEGGRGGDMLGFSGILQVYPDAAPVSGWRCDGSCACVHLRFDVDDFGRLYIPNATTFTVSVRDNAGNEIVRFGRYGNFDCQGPGSTEPTPEIPLGWPIAVGTSDKYIYVGDCLNHRVVRVDKAFALEATCAVE